MNLDVSIHRMAIREAETLGIAQTVVARKRQELELRLLREKVLKGEHPNGADFDDALAEMDAESKAARPDAGTGAFVDKTA
jgi:hypothetical protein